VNENRCEVLTLKGAMYETCGAPIGDDGRCALGHAIGSDPAGASKAKGPSGLGAVEQLHRGALRYKFFSVDDHIIEPPDVWTSRVPARFRGRAPHVVEEDGREYWQYEDTRSMQMGLNAVAGKPRDQWNMEPARYSDMILGCYNPTQRARDMLSDGIVASVCFPTLPRFGGALFATFGDKELADVCVQGYNDFLFDDWCAAAPEMFVPMPIVQVWDPERAAAEIRRTAEKGARAICMPEECSLLGLPSYYSDFWDPIWRALTEVDIPVCMHIGSSGMPVYRPEGAPFSFSIALSFVGAAIHSVGLMMSPVPRKFPTIKIVISEGGIGWVPAALERADRHYDRQRLWAGGDDLLPSEIASRNFYWCMIEEPWGLSARDVIGVERIMWECDYPHTDSTWPNSQSTAGDILDTIPRGEADLIAFRNAERLFQWKCIEPARVQVNEKVVT
jgi:predicted TIM-barrel fold metal-dependent hydrolase